MFLSLFLILFFGIIGGILFEKIKIPKIVWYLILGILLGPSLLNLIDNSLLQISTYLRQIALVIILTRSGLSLNVKTLKEIGASAIMMCFLPASFEIVGIVIFAPILLGISYFEAMLLGSVLAAVSPAVVVPRMIKLKDEGYGDLHHIPELIMAGSSCDDIYVIVLFYSFKNLVANDAFDALTLLQIPSSIIFGVLLGLLIGVIVSFSFKKIPMKTPLKIIILLSLSFGMLAFEEWVKQYVSISSLLGIIVTGIIINKSQEEGVEEIKKGYESLWNGFEILLFALVGAATDTKLAFSKEGAIILGLIVIALVFRSFGVLVSVIDPKYTLKERLFIIVSYLPKATVQASIGGIALSEGLSCGSIILTAAVVSILLTAPLGAILMDTQYKRLLRKNEIIIESERKDK